MYVYLVVLLSMSKMTNVTKYTDTVSHKGTKTHSRGLPPSFVKKVIVEGSPDPTEVLALTDTWIGVSGAKRINKELDYKMELCITIPKKLERTYVLIRKYNSHRRIGMLLFMLLCYLKENHK